MSLYLWIPDEDLRSRTREHIAKRRLTDSGVDLLSPAFSLKGGSPPALGVELKTGVVAAALTYLGEPAPYLLLARSSTSLTPLRMSNQIGLADAGYRGELIARVDCFDTFEIEKGRRLFQIVQHNWMPFMKVVVVDSPDALPPPPDSRGSGGFGSTGQ